MSFIKRNSYRDQCINLYKVFIGGEGGGERCVKSNNLTGEIFNCQKKADSQFSSKLVISIPSFPKKVRNLRIAKPYFAPCISKKITLKIIANRPNVTCDFLKVYSFLPPSRPSLLQ